MQRTHSFRWQHSKWRANGQGTCLGCLVASQRTRVSQLSGRQAEAFDVCALNLGMSLHAMQRRALARVGHTHICGQDDSLPATVAATPPWCLLFVGVALADGR